MFKTSRLVELDIALQMALACPKLAQNELRSLIESWREEIDFFQEYGFQLDESKEDTNE